MTQRKNVQQSTMAFATSCRHRRRKRVIRWKFCLWTLFQFNQSLSFSRKIHFELTLPFDLVQKLREINFEYCCSEKRFHGKSKTVKNFASINLSHLHEKNQINLDENFLPPLSNFQISALSPVKCDFLQSPKSQICTHFLINSTQFHVTFWIKSFNDFSSRSFFPTQNAELNKTEKHLLIFVYVFEFPAKIFDRPAH